MLTAEEHFQALLRAVEIVRGRGPRALQHAPNAELPVEHGGVAAGGHGRAWEKMCDATVATHTSSRSGRNNRTSDSESESDGRPIVDDAIAKTGPQSPPPRPIVLHRPFNPDPFALDIIDGARQLGLEPEFSQPYTAFVLSDASTAEKFMDKVIGKTRAMGHPDMRALRMIGISFKTETRSGHAPLTMALAEGLVAVFDVSGIGRGREMGRGPMAITISKIRTSRRSLPTSLEYILGKGGALKVGFDIKKNCMRFPSLFNVDFKMHSVFNIDDIARANGLPDDSIRSHASHVGVLPATEDATPIRTAIVGMRMPHSPRCVFSVFSVVGLMSATSPGPPRTGPTPPLPPPPILAVRGVPPGNGGFAGLLRSQSRLRYHPIPLPRLIPLPPRYVLLVFCLDVGKLASPSESASYSVSPSRSNLASVSYISRPSKTDVSKRTKAAPSKSDIWKRKTATSFLNCLSEVNVIPTSPEAMEVLLEDYGLTPRTLTRVQRGIRALSTGVSPIKVQKPILTVSGHKHRIPLDTVVMKMMQAGPAPVPQPRSSPSKGSFVARRRIGGIARALSKGHVRPTLGALMQQVLVLKPNVKFTFRRVGLSMVVAEASLASK
ncbi:hypothetical protein BDK51DRAFT_51487 [Blyttiomyces helicus]|uniref:Uncharacterized protein n=1 Tax=Blyttiomyces helicus TaxID=388810 RepID=A0A4P9WLW9_9FUNG|nr:hypothetical protein BDK51DRAFT_51487 [Blyttiomyces helicus]|eukprot:RKO92140.1 hypothetical protein BDK51DRAFT_51487 [Blyttiomyces helicus]